MINSIKNFNYTNSIKERPGRATGLALQLSAMLLKCIQAPSSNIFLFTGGPCTIGPGRITTQDMKAEIRRELDINTNADTKSFSENSKEFYD